MNNEQNLPLACKYKYYMHINNAAFSPNHTFDAIMSTFESGSDWDKAVRAQDTATCIAIIKAVTEFCKTHRVPSAVVDFYRTMPRYLNKKMWKKMVYNGIVDAYADEDADEYVDGITGL